MVNKVILIGNVGKDPEVRRLESGAVVANFSIATSENYKNKSGEWQQNTEWHDIVTWRTLAEKVEKQIRKGVAVYIEGKITTRTWEDKDGNKRKNTEVVANYFRLLSSRSDGSSNQNGATPAPATKNNGKDDDLPF